MKPRRTPSNGLETANQEQKSQPGSWAIAFVFMLFSSSVRRSTFHWNAKIFPGSILSCPGLQDAFFVNVFEQPRIVPVIDMHSNEHRPWRIEGFL
jgi:hypothetical protein